MKKLFLIPAVCLLLMICSLAAAAAEAHTYKLALDANAGTAYEWTAFMLGGTSVEIDEEKSGYVFDPYPPETCGARGTHYFMINALTPGDTVIRFTYARGWLGRVARETVMLFSVDDALEIHPTDITKCGVYSGIVTGVNAEEHCAVLDSEQSGEIVARFSEVENLPALNEQITVYTDGSVAETQPPTVNAVAWNRELSAAAR